jgi:NACalpha-BTF3-like transcription factor
VAIVMEKAGCSEEEARATLTETNGDLAEAIFRLAEG